MVLPQEVREQVLAYTRHQGSKSLAELASLTERTGDECSEAVREVSEEQASFQYDDEWSINAVLAHLIESMVIINRGIASLAAGRLPRPISGVGRASDKKQPIEELRRELAEAWADTARLAASLPEDGDREATREHPWFGPLNFREWIAFQRVHALDHVQQIKRIKAHPDYAKE